MNIHRDGTRIPIEVSTSRVTGTGGELALGIVRDITERAQARKALEESEKRYRALFEDVPISLWEEDFSAVKTTIDNLRARGVTDLETYFADNPEAVVHCATLAKILDVNRATLDLYGAKSKDDLLGKLDRVLDPESYATFREELLALARGESQFSTTIINQTLAGDKIYVNLRLSVHPLAQDTWARVLISLTDVTERARLEQENEGRRLYLESVLDSANDAIVTMDEHGLVLEWNSGAERLFGYPAAEAIGQKLDSLVTGNNVEAYKEAAGYTQVALAGERIPPSEVTRYRADGTPLQVILSASPILIKEQMIGAMAVYTDITERVQVEKERSRLLVQIQEQARQIQQVMNTVPEGVLLLDPTGRVMLANPLAERELSTLANAGVGDTLTQLGGRPLAELLAPAPDGPRHELKVDSPQARIFELSARPTNFWPDRTLSAKESEGWVLVIRDVTQEREIEQRVQQQERLAAVGQLAAGIAHDFNNILAVIVLYTQMGLRTPDLSQDLRHRLETVERQAKRATDLIQQILDFSRKAVLEQQPLDLKLFIKEQVKLLQRTVPENIQIELTHGADEYTVNADPTRMQQVIVNLAVNARDAMPDGGKLDIALTRTSYSDGIMCTTCAQIKGGEWVKLTVGDDGTGIPADVLPHIFEPFFTTKEVGKGTGLGLAQVFGTVKQHEGHLEVTSTVGEGTSFAIHLPALLLTEPKTLIQDKPGLIHGRGETILLVEDNPVMLQAMLVSLESLNYQVLRASSGREALAIFAQHRKEIDLVLSDLVMPEIGGMELFQALKMREPAIKMILISGYPLHQEIEDLQAQGITNWLQKPVNLDHLAQVIARALD